ncbi:hypothetical protein U9M48_039394 [Paspalum notatum var. saurae]|uniref:Uncharacterized protein n=1 Tax=Paspalum notatum var. saurae TaxID=547442 RepID=A0AAQ3UQ68_PASNO
MADNQVWNLVESLDEVRPIECKWGFKKKIDIDGNVHIYKAQLVAKGFRQIQGVDYDETFSPIAMLKSIRILLAIAANHDYEPDGFVDPRNAGKNVEEPCVYKKVSGSALVFLVLYVDDILLIGNDIPMLEAVKDSLRKSFSMKDLGEAAYILGIKIYRDRSKCLIGLSQSTYIDIVLKRFNMHDSKKGFLHMSPGTILSKTQCPSTTDEQKRMSEIPYASAIGSIIYAMICTRLDVSFALSVTSKYQSCLGEGHWIAVKNILKYLRRTKDAFLVFGGEEELVVKGSPALAPIPLGTPIHVKTDHCSLKFLLDQRLATIPQHQWASKLIVFDFSVKFKPGHANVVANALSRRDADDPPESLACLALSRPCFSLFYDLRIELEQATDLGAIRTQALAGQDGWSVVDGLWIKVFVPASSPLVTPIIILLMPITPNMKEYRGHSTGFVPPSTFQVIKVASVIMCYLAGCQQNKIASLQPGATTVARAFFAEIVRLHGIPSFIVSDRDPVFTSAFWWELFRLSGGDRPRQWVQWLAWPEYCYNSSYQASLGTSPFNVVYGRDPPSLRAYDGSSAKLPAVDQQLKEWDEFLVEIRDRLEQAQQTQKAQHDRGHREVIFTPSQWVWLRLLHRPAASMDIRGRGKVGPRFYGPFKVLERVGNVAYRLQPQPSAKLHKVFHVGLLKPYSGPEPTQPSTLPPVRHGRVCPLPQQVLRGRLVQGLPEHVHWQGRPADASWVPLEEFRQLYPSFQLEDELIVQEGEMSCTGVNTRDGIGRIRPE